MQIKWDRLCRNISENNVIAVLGNEIFKFKQGDKLFDIEKYFATILLTKYEASNDSCKTIIAAVEFLLNEKKADIRDINDDLKTITETKLEHPLLDKFIDIDQLLFYVNTTVYGNILKNSISAMRGKTCVEGNFSINESFGDYGDINALEKPFVFNIFGSLTDNVAPALKEEEMLEFTTALIGKIKIVDEKFTSILDSLKNKTLLFLGCSQPGWLIRFFFRIISNERIDNWEKRQSDIIIVNDKDEDPETLLSFLKNYKAINYPGSTSAFIDELASNWSDWIKEHPPKPKNIFISYSHKDKDAADILYGKLAAIEHVQCWYDNSELKSGDNFTTKIIVNIDNADLFIPLISNNSLAGDSTYVKREWLTAFNTNVMRSKKPDHKQKYILPIVIDAADLGNSVIKEYFPSLTIAQLPGGNAGDDFINMIKQELELI